MATITNIPTLIFSPKPCTIQCRESAFKVCFNPITSSLSSSRSRSLAIKCVNDTNANANANPQHEITSGVMNGLQSSWIYKSMDPKDLDNFKSGIADQLRKTKGLDDIVWGVIKQVLPKPEIRGFVEGLAKARENVDAAEMRFEQKENEIKEMKERFHQLRNRDAEIEKCNKGLSEVRALVEEAERSLQLVMNALEH